MNKYSSRHVKIKVVLRSLTIGLVSVVFFNCSFKNVNAQNLHINRFEAIGINKPLRLDSAQFGERKKPAVEVHFDLLPISMKFYLPSFPCMISENNIQYSNFWAETYDPRVGEGSFETLQDRDYKYARMWIESQNSARIIVRVRGALCDIKGNIAHTDIPSGSPYGKGDWVDEWYYIYPDGMHTRFVRIYTGLASQSRPFGFDREPPAVVHEFMESAVIGLPGHLPSDDIEIGALTLIKIIGDHLENKLQSGVSKTIFYKPYPEGFGDFRDANIMVVNLKSRFKPFTIALPYGVRVQPYMPEGPLPYIFQTWGKPPEKGYSTSFGHILNFWHYRRTENMLEQIYLSGMTNAGQPDTELVPLAWSWIIPARVHMEGLKDDYNKMTYDPTQKAYVLSYPEGKPKKVKFELIPDKEYYDIEQTIINPVVIVKDWGEAPVSLEINGKHIEQGKDFRIGYESNGKKTDLVLWLNLKTKKLLEFEIKRNS